MVADPSLAVEITHPLFVPADRPDRVRKARERGAGVVVIDLEDAVAIESKPTARALAAQVLAEYAPTITHLVRVNGLHEQDLFEADITALQPVLGHVDGVILPKVACASDVQAAEALLHAMGPAEWPGVAIIPTIETAAGVRAAWDIAAASPRVHTLLFGVADLSAQLGVTPTADGQELLMARSSLVLACAAAGRRKPIDGPSLDLDDEATLRRSALHARQLGFGAKAAIHPKQIPVLVEVFAPSVGEIEWARAVVTAFDAAVAAGLGVARLDDGTFIDAPVAQRARSIVTALARGASE